MLACGAKFTRKTGLCRYLLQCHFLSHTRSKKKLWNKDTRMDQTFPHPWELPQRLCKKEHYTYMHAAAYHLQDVLNRYGNVKQFSGQGVEKNNDVARATVIRKSRNWDSPADVIRAEHRMNQLCNRERQKRKYTKLDGEFWRNGKRQLMIQGKQRGCISTHMASCATNEHI